MIIQHKSQLGSHDQHIRAQLCDVEQTLDLLLLTHLGTVHTMDEFIVYGE